MTKFISDEMMEAALHFLAGNSEKGAIARAARFQAEHNRKKVRSHLILKSEHKVSAMREAWAETHPQYEKAVADEADAIREDEYYRSERHRCDTIIEAWRSEQANQRAGSNFR